ncbi:MAG: twitch domain-containing radical SAM protein [Candidatus Omnitrophica bacterium]|nr:twitch domain-containing radical SAM protein [Candidatus Omnitrophota bacterium]
MHNKAFRSACYAPFVNLDFSPNGEVLVCCVNTRYVVGRVPDQTISEIWSAEPIQLLRQALKQYDFSLDCERCRWQVELGNLNGVFARRDDRFRVTEEWPKGPQRMDFRLSNICNYACVMCNGDYSSVLRAQEGRRPFPKVYGDPFFNQLRDFIPNLKFAMFGGGEPFLIPEHHKVWDLFIESGPHIKCTINTNASILNDTVWHYLENIHFENIGVSFDGATAHTFEAVRQKASFEQVYSNLKQIKAHANKKRRKVHLAVCVTRQNWMEFPDIVRLGEDLGCPINVNLVHHPPDCSLYELPADQIQEVHTYLDLHFKRLQNRISQESAAHYGLLLESLQGASTQNSHRPFFYKPIAEKQ